jgi:hypothetical protein
MIELLLAQAAPIQPDEAIGWAERMSKGGVPVISLCVAIAATIGAILLFKKLLEKEEKNTALETTYRTDLEKRHAQAVADAEKRVTEAKTEAKERAAEIDKIMRERMAVERESDATLAKAVLALEGNTKQLEKVDRLLEEVRSLLQRTAVALERRA